MLDETYRKAVIDAIMCLTDLLKTQDGITVVIGQIQEFCGQSGHDFVSFLPYNDCSVNTVRRGKVIRINKRRAVSRLGTAPNTQCRLYPE